MVEVSPDSQAQTVPELPVVRPEDITPKLNPIYVGDGAGLEKLKAGIARIGAKKFPSVEIDYETNMVETYWDRRARVFAIGDIHEQFVIDFLPFAGSTDALVSGQGNYKPALWARPILEIIQPILESKDFLKVGQNLGFEYEVSSWCLGMRPWNMYSIDIAERVLWAGLHTFKDLHFYSLASMTERYFKKRLDKTHQTTFDLESRLTDEDLAYSGLDLRVPNAIRQFQLKRLVAENLYRVTTIENNAIGAFIDMHLNGMRVDTAAWGALIAEWTVKYREAIERMDSHFIAVVGKKHIPEGDLQPLFDRWKELTEESAAELEIKAQKKATKDKGEKELLEGQRKSLETERKASAATARQEWQSLKTRQREAREIAEKCIGEAAINYGSNKQVRAALLRMKGFTAANLPDTEDDTLKKHDSKPVIAAMRDFRTYEKLKQTYGEAWITEWTTKPLNEEGWISPHDHKIHSIIQQLEAETGRTSSIKPNTQNLPHDKRVRACFICDPPNEDIRISCCCDADTVIEAATGSYRCTACGSGCITKAEEYCIVTIDMSGAELRIIAEDSGAKTMVEAFQKKWDVHSVGAELLFPEEWPLLAAKPGELNGDGKELPQCAYFHNDHKKCQCPGHLEKRDDNKAANFLIVYGGQEDALAAQTDKSKEECAVLLGKHRKANPEVWLYLDRQGRMAVQNLEARDRSGRRRIFRKPDWAAAKERARERMFEREKKKSGGKNPDGSKFTIEQCHPNQKQISSALRGMWSSIERQGKNMPIQGLNATIAKLAMGCGFDKDGKPYMWHLLPAFKAFLINFVHDEFVIHCPKRYGKQVLNIVGDCIRRAAAEFMTLIEMEWEGRSMPYWCK